MFGWCVPTNYLTYRSSKLLTWFASGQVSGQLVLHKLSVIVCKDLAALLQRLRAVPVNA